MIRSLIIEIIWLTIKSLKNYLFKTNVIQLKLIKDVIQLKWIKKCDSIKINKTNVIQLKSLKKFNSIKINKKMQSN